MYMRLCPFDGAGVASLLLSRTCCECFAATARCCVGVCVCEMPAMYGYVSM